MVKFTISDCICMRWLLKSDVKASMLQNGKEIEKTIKPLLYTQGDLDEVIKARENEWQQRQDEFERKIKEEIAMRELLEEDHRSKLDSLKKANGDMKMVVSQYEKTIMDLTEQSRNTPVIDGHILSETVRAKDQLHNDLNAAEENLVDAYKRIEKLKLAVDTYKGNEENLKTSVKDYQTKLQKSEERYNKLKQHATEKIDAANAEIDRIRKQKEIDLAGIEASLKKSQNRVSNLEVEIAQKGNENKELSQICDELIKKVSGE